MIESIRSIFEHNMKILGDMDKTVYHFRGQQCDQALAIMADSIDKIKLVIEAIINDRVYFNLVDTESMLEMLTGILEAKKNKDFVLLADLLELQLINFLVGVQELIISKEEIVFNEDNYKENISLLMERGIGFPEQLKEPINTIKLLESGYRVEFTSCGLMTLAGESEGTKFYFHTNNRIQGEAYLLAKNWYDRKKTKYIIYGFGMGYHIKELQEMAPEAEIEIYEADINVIQLACAFTEVKELILNEHLKVIFDPGLELLQKRIKELGVEEVFHVHYPSFKNLRRIEEREILDNAIPWCKTIEAC